MVRNVGTEKVLTAQPSLPSTTGAAKCRMDRHSIDSGRELKSFPSNLELCQFYDAVSRLTCTVLVPRLVCNADYVPPEA